MEKFLKKVKDFETVLLSSNDYATQLKNFKQSKFGESSEQIAHQLKRYAMEGIGKNTNPDEYCEDIESKAEYNKGNDSKNYLQGEFRDSVEDFVKQDCKKNQNEQPFIEGFNLRDAMIAKEILDKPLCKRRRRGFRGGR